MTEPQNEAQALVVVPFHDESAAHAWANEITLSFPEHLKPIVTTGSESVLVDSARGRVTEELVLTTGWRAIYAGDGQVVVHRTRSLS